MIKQGFLLTLALSLCMLQGIKAQDMTCGTTLEDNAAIKEQMLQNRANINRSEIDFLRNKRTITYIPVTVHLIANIDSTGAPTVQSAVNTICNLNTYFLDMGIQYYFHPTRPINYLYNSTVFNDGYSNTSIGIMGMNKTPNAMNIYIGDRVSSNVAGYYSRGGDFVFIRKSEANITSKTLPHEIGHFFTLPHTFYGWEGQNYDSVYAGTNAPVRISNRSVEFKARTGAHANCATAADGFCDTEADYYSYRVSCNHNTVVLDPNGERLTPNPRNYMSYFADNCLDVFSNEQQDAIWASIRQRNWLNFPAPNTFVTNNVTNFLQVPANGDSLVYTTYEGSNLEFSWAKQANAVGYIFRIERVLMGQGLGNLQDKWIPNTTANTIKHYFSLPRQGNYRWSVSAIGANGCETLIHTNEFYADVVVSVNEVNGTTKENGHNIILMPNPVEKGQRITANIASHHDVRANVRIVSLDGRLAWEQKVDLFADVDNLIHFDSESLATGMYILQVQSEFGTSNSKIVIR